MKQELRDVLFHSVNKYNILPLTSRCNVNCIFCSHKQNPSGIHSYSIQNLSWTDIEDMMIFLSPHKKIIIGESATRVMEGEPLTHPLFEKVLIELRKRFPKTTIQITTNGNLLTDELVRKMKELEPLEINISLNSSIAIKRQTIMNDYRAENAIQAVSKLNHNQINYNGSIVALPLPGWQDDLERTIGYLQENGANTLRIFLPGVTRYRKNIEEMGFKNNILFGNWEVKMNEFVIKCRNRYTIPITLEPSGIKDLIPDICGVIKNSKADHMGIKAGTRILSIDGSKPFSRIEAFNALNAPGEHKITICENKGSEKYLSLLINEGERSGLVMDYDMPLWMIESIEEEVSNYDPDDILILASEGGAGLIKEGLVKKGLNELKDKIKAVKNMTFGGNIKAAGLLMVNDFTFALDEYLLEGKKPKLLLLPSIAFDHRGKDLRGIDYLEIEEAFNIKVKYI